MLCQLQQNFYLHIIQVAKGGIWVEAEGLTLLQVNILPAAEVEDTTSVCFLRTSFPAQCWQQHVTGAAEEDGVSISHADHEVSGARAPFSSLMTMVFFLSA